MMRLIRFACVLGCLASPMAARAQDGPICGSPVVLDAVARLLAKAGSAAQVEGRSVGQAPTARLDTVLCTVRLLDPIYDTNRFGPLPLLRQEVFEYTVRRVRTAVLVAAYPG